jgi:alkylation response protein AidB-like acyl-CoA dehydrogenase
LTVYYSTGSDLVHQLPQPTAAYLLLVQWLPISAILAAGSAEQKAKLLPGLAEGRVRGAFSTSEPQSGSDISGIKTKAVRQTRDGKDGYVIDGAKIWCTNAAVADFVVVAAKVVAEGQEPPKTGAALNFFVVPRNTPGFTIGRHEDKMGGRGVPSSPLFFEDVWVPRENMLGEEGKGFKAVMEAFNHSRPLIAARGVGLAQGALDKAIDFVKGRRAFGQALSDFQGLRWMVADMVSRTFFSFCFNFNQSSDLLIPSTPASKPPVS